MKLAITGAAGFLGQSLVRHLRQVAFTGEVRLVDRAFATEQPFETLALDLTEPNSVQSALDGIDCVIHLAALPGGAAQRDPVASRRINLDLPLAMIESLAGRRIIYASSIAALGGAFPASVDDATVPQPDSVYGTHKRMVELAFADAIRRGAITGLALRLPGIVARPPAAEGFGSAFLSDVFHAAKEGLTYTLPVSSDATSWLMSAEICAANLLRAATLKESEAAAVNLPVLTVRMEQLLAELGRVSDVTRIEHQEDPPTRRAFGSYPPLVTRRAEALGFVSDNSLSSLVTRALGRG